MAPQAIYLQNTKKRDNQIITDRVNGTGNPWAGQVSATEPPDDVGVTTLISALRNFGLALVTGSKEQNQRKSLMRNHIFCYLKAGTGYPCAGQASVATSSTRIVASNVLTETPENFGLALAMGSTREHNFNIRTCRDKKQKRKKLPECWHRISLHWTQ